MNETFDVAIIGGGPAGETFASELSAASPDKKILLVDGSSE